MTVIRHRRSVATTVRVAVISYLIVTLTLIASGLLMTHVLLRGSVGRWDDRIITFALQQRTPGWDRISADTTYLANTLGILVVGGAVTVGVLLWRRTRWALLIPIALVLELASFLSVNYAVRRPRPAVPHVGSTPSTFSWPSGHVAATFVLYGGIAVILMHVSHRRAPAVLAWIFAAVLTTGVALSRVYEGEHHPTDVLAGLVLGLGILAGTTHALRAVRISETSAATRARRNGHTAALPAQRDGLVHSS